MTGEHRLSLSPTVVVVGVLSTLLIGVAGTYLIMRPGASSAPMSGMSRGAGSTSTPSAAAGGVAAAGVEGATSRRSDVVVTLTSEAVQRAGIETSGVTPTAGTDHIRLPGVVEPNAYRQVAVTPLVGGRVVRVSAQLGDRVRRGQALAEVYSPELAEARTKYTAA
jgi:multidrug efflux pump subunit AcrA (membrane-fusion protein)